MPTKTTKTSPNEQGWKPDHWSKDGKRAYEVEDVTHWMPLPQPPQNP